MFIRWISKLKITLFSPTTIMATEYELKVLNIDVEALKGKLNSLWAEKQTKKKFRRYVYDMNPPQKDKRIRLRTDGQTTTLTVKHIVDEQAIDGVKEWEVLVDDLDQMNSVLEQLGFKAKGYQENIRESFLLDDCSLEIDSRPHIPTYLEIEWPSEESVLKMLKKLGLENELITSENTISVYLRYWKDIKDYKILSFDEKE